MRAISLLCGMSRFFTGITSSIIRNSVIGNSSGNILVVNGNRITSSFGGMNVPEAKSIRLVAVDADGKEMDNYSLPANCELKIVISAGEGTIDEVTSASANITVEKVHRINNLKTASGDVTVGQVRGDIHNISTMSGDVKVDSAVNVGHTSTMSGDIKVHRVTGMRDSSPTRHTSKGRKKNK